MRLEKSKLTFESEKIEIKNSKQLLYFFILFIPNLITYLMHVLLIPLDYKL